MNTEESSESQAVVILQIGRADGSVAEISIGQNDDPILLAEDFKNNMSFKVVNQLAKQIKEHRDSALRDWDSNNLNDDNNKLAGEKEDIFSDLPAVEDHDDEISSEVDFSQAGVVDNFTDDVVHAIAASMPSAYPYVGTGSTDEVNNHTDADSRDQPVDNENKDAENAYLRAQANWSGGKSNNNSFSADEKLLSALNISGSAQRTKPSTPSTPRDYISMAKDLMDTSKKSNSLNLFNNLRINTNWPSDVNSESATNDRKQSVFQRLYAQAQHYRQNKVHLSNRVENEFKNSIDGTSFLKSVGFMPYSPSRKRSHSTGRIGLRREPDDFHRDLYERDMQWAQRRDQKLADLYDQQAMKKEAEEMNDVTHHPSLVTSPKRQPIDRYRSRDDLFDALYANKDIYQKRQADLLKKVDDERSEYSYFVPKIDRKSAKIAKRVRQDRADLLNYEDSSTIATNATGSINYSVISPLSSRSGTPTGLGSSYTRHHRWTNNRDKNLYDRAGSAIEQAQATMSRFTARENVSVKSYNSASVNLVKSPGEDDKSYMSPSKNSSKISSNSQPSRQSNKSKGKSTAGSRQGLEEGLMDPMEPNESGDLESVDRDEMEEPNVRSKLGYVPPSVVEPGLRTNSPSLFKRSPGERGRASQRSPTTIRSLSADSAPRRSLSPGSISGLSEVSRKRILARDGSIPSTPKLSPNGDFSEADISPLHPNDLSDQISVSRVSVQSSSKLNLFHSLYEYRHHHENILNEAKAKHTPQHSHSPRLISSSAHRSPNPSRVRAYSGGDGSTTVENQSESVLNIDQRNVESQPIYDRLYELRHRKDQLREEQFLLMRCSELGISPKVGKRSSGGSNAPLEDLAPPPPTTYVLSKEDSRFHSNISYMDSGNALPPEKISESIDRLAVRDVAKKVTNKKDFIDQEALRNKNRIKSVTMINKKSEKMVQDIRRTALCEIFECLLYSANLTKEQLVENGESVSPMKEPEPADKALPLAQRIISDLRLLDTVKARPEMLAGDSNSVIKQVIGAIIEQARPRRITLHEFILMVEGLMETKQAPPLNMILGVRSALEPTKAELKRRKEKLLTTEDLLMQQCTGKPDLFARKKTEELLSKNWNRSSLDTKGSGFYNQRLQHYSEHKSKALANIAAEDDKKLSAECTFKPYLITSDPKHNGLRKYVCNQRPSSVGRASTGSNSTKPTKEPVNAREFLQRFIS